MRARKFKRLHHWRDHRAVIVGLLIALIVMGFIILSTRASSPAAALNSAQGVVKSPATILNDTTASGGRAVQFSMANLGQPRPTGNVPGNWSLKFDDEFNGTGLNTANWSTGWLASGITPPVQNQELACYDPAQVTVGGGMLHLSAIAKSQTCGGQTRPYTSGMINSSDKQAFSNGFFEVRMWLDNSGGVIANWPAWWLDGHNWPTTGELDIMEGLSGSAQATWHGPLNGGAGFPVGGAGALTGWHTFAAQWGNGKVTAYYDGANVGAYQNSTNVTTGPLFLILGNQIGPPDKYGGPIKIPSEILVDYVRVWQ